MVLCDHTFLDQLEEELLHFVLTADDKETTASHPHTKHYNSLPRGNKNMNYSLSLSLGKRSAFTLAESFKGGKKSVLTVELFCLSSLTELSKTTPRLLKKGIL